MAQDSQPEFVSRLAHISSKENDGKGIPRLTPRTRRKTSNGPLEPPPPTPMLPAAPEPGSFSPVVPERRILSPEDHEAFLSSPTNDLVQAWIFGLCDSVKGKSTSFVDGLQKSSTVCKVDQILDDTAQLLNAFPPLDTGSRFGNPVFRDFHRTLAERLLQIHVDLFDLSHDLAQEVSTYLQNSFGSEERLDYGSGHELNFALWLLCFNRIGKLSRDDFPMVVLHIFPYYWKLMRRIQSTYYLEPAGSHGVWGLDDYQFLPFLFGASQLIGHPYITPRAIHNAAILDEEGDKYLYLDQARWVDSVKTVKGIRWHSPMLDDISSAKNWQKVEDGMRKMFVKEILGKLPIMQHFLFGSLIPAAKGMGEVDSETLRLQAQRMQHVREQGHEPDYWGDCCGIKVPSTVAAGEEMRKRLGTFGGLRPIPFD